ncbi:MAG: protein kinase domain-containing protein [Polyangiaceae bacterium]
MGDLATPHVLGRYAIYGKIAAGGMASVHFGRLLGEAGFSRTVAIKRLHGHLSEDPEFLRTLIDEARLAARINHPHVVPTLDVVATDTELLVIMEYVRGESLARLLRSEMLQGRRVPLEIASAIAIGTLHGLHAAHEATSDQGAPLGIVHRDVSPQNILVGVDGLARVIDFGIAKAAGRLQTTSSGVIKGKIAYMAPEQAAMNEVTRAADVYSMGAVLWETLTGKRLFPSDNDFAVIGQVLEGAKDPPSYHAPNVPAQLDALVMKALASNPAARFASAQDMAETLLHAVPPAFPTDVGKWVEELARESLTKRGALLAEIESSSDRVTSPPARSSPALTRIERSGGTRAPTKGAADVSTVLVHRGRDLNDDVPTVASQQTSLSVETTPRLSAAPTRRRPTRPEALGAAGVLLVACIAAALWGRSGAPSGASGVEQAPPRSVVPSEVDRAPPREALPTGADRAPQAESAPPPEPTIPVSPLPPPKTIPVSPLPPPKAIAPRPVARPAPNPSRATDRPADAARAKCNPPYYFDGRGVRVFKPECL